tara:strand:+ start:27 stop:590 length:564 start_codon:yes stop_codon:yes gene_type:complete
MKYFSDVNWLWYDKSSRQFTKRCIIRLNVFEGCLLWKYIKKTEGDVIEIGRLHGGSTILISEALSDSKRKLHSIDPVNAIKDECKTHIKENSSRINLIEMTSQDAHEKIKFNNTDCIFIDGDHSYEGVKSDTELYWKYLDIGGYMIYHDYLKTLKWGVFQFCNEWISQGYMKKIEHVESMAVFQKIK